MPASLDQIRQAVCSEFGITDLSHRLRTRQYADARMVYMTLAWENGYGTGEISASVNKHHSMVSHSRKKLRDYMEADPVLRRKYQFVENEVGI